MVNGNTIRDNGGSGSTEIGGTSGGKFNVLKRFSSVDLQYTS